MCVCMYVCMYTAIITRQYIVQMGWKKNCIFELYMQMRAALIK